MRDRNPAVSPAYILLADLPSGPRAQREKAIQTISHPNLVE